METFYRMSSIFDKGDNLCGILFASLLTNPFPKNAVCYKRVDPFQKGAKTQFWLTVSLESVSIFTCFICLPDNVSKITD